MKTPATLTRIVPGKQFLAEPYYPPSQLMRGVHFDIEAHRDAASAEIETAYQDIETTRAAVTAECEEMRTQALAQVERVVAAAHAEGLAMAERATAELLGRLAKQVDAQQRHYASQVARAAFVLARAVMATELHHNPEALLGLLQRVVDRARDKTRIEIRVPGSLHQVVEAARAQIEAMLPAGAQLRVVADVELAADAVVVSTERGAYAASVRSELHRLRAHLGARAAELIAGMPLEEV